MYGIPCRRWYQNPKSTDLHEVLRIVTVFFETWIISGEIMIRAVTYSSNTSIIKYNESVEGINILMFCITLPRLQAWLGKSRLP